MIIKSFNHSFSSEDFDHFSKLNRKQSLLKSLSLNSHHLELAQSIVNKLNKTQNIIIVSYGSSHLLIKDLLQFALKKEVRFIFINHLDYKKVKEELGNLDREHTSVLFFSKSGKTKEILQMASFLHENFSFKNSFFTSSQLNSDLEEFAKENHLPFFYFPNSLPNRFNLFSPVYLICMLISGIDPLIVENHYSSYEPTTQLASIIHLHNLKKFSNICFCYDSRSQEELVRYLCNTWNESLGSCNFPVFAQALYTPEFFHSSIEYFASNNQFYYLKLSQKDSNSYYLDLLTQFLKEGARPYSEVYLENTSSSRLELTKLFHQVLSDLAIFSQGKLMEQNIVDKWKQLPGPI